MLAALGGGILIAQQTSADGSAQNLSPDDPEAQAIEREALYDETSLSLEETPEADVDISTPSSLGAVLRALGALALTAVLIYLVVYWLKRIGRPKQTEDTRLKILASAHLGANRFVHVVAVGDQAWVIGAADNSVSLIAEIQDKETKDLLFLDESRRSEQKTARTIDFKSLFARMVPGAAGIKDDQKPASLKAVRERRERLRDL